MRAPQACRQILSQLSLLSLLPLPQDVQRFFPARFCVVVTLHNSRSMLALELRRLRSELVLQSSANFSSARWARSNYHSSAKAIS